MPVFRMARMAMVVVVALACGADGVLGPIRNLENSAATRDCGPADGPATSIYLAAAPVGSIEPPPPFVRIYVAAAVEELGGTVWQMSDGSPQGAAWFHSVDASFDLATSGYLVVSSVGSDNTVEGSVYLEFPDAGRISGSFRATWVPRSVVCV